MSRFRVLDADSSLTDCWKSLKCLKTWFAFLFYSSPSNVYRKRLRLQLMGTDSCSYLCSHTLWGRCEETGLQCELGDKRKQQTLAWLSCALSCSVVTEAPSRVRSFLGNSAYMNAEESYVCLFSFQRITSLRHHWIRSSTYDTFQSHETTESTDRENSTEGMTRFCKKMNPDGNSTTKRISLRRFFLLFNH